MGGGSGARERDLSAMTKQYSSRDLPSHQSLKSRDRGQNAPEDIAGRDFRRELEERERMASITKEKERGRGRLVDREKEDFLTSSDKPQKRLKMDQNLDADDPLDDSDADVDSDSDSDDDETAALMAELQKIKREKAADEQEKEEKKKKKKEKIRM